MELVKDQLTEHFRLSEFDCKGQMLITPQFITMVHDVLEPFRVWYNRPININSGYRTAEHNKKVGGVSNSLHLKGLAVDFNLPAEYHSYPNARKKEYLNNVTNKWNQLCNNAGGFGQICWYDGFLHLGMSYNKQSLTDYRKNKF